MELPPAERVRNFLEMRVGPGGADPVVLPLPPSTMAKLQQTLQWNSLQRNVAPASSMDGAEELLRVVAAAVHADEIVVGPSESWTAIMTNAAIVRVLLVRPRFDSFAPCPSFFSKLAQFWFLLGHVRFHVFPSDVGLAGSGHGANLFLLLSLFPYL